MAYTAEQFLNIIKPAVIADMQKTKILASLTAAQALIESNKGNSGLTQKANNLFGIKANSAWKGPYVTMKTKENYGSGLVTVDAKFRAYANWQESINDHSNFLLTNKRYKNLIGVTDYKTACVLIKQDGYATSATYTKTLTDTIEKYNLWLWDLEALGGSLPVQPPFVLGKTYTLQSNMYVRNTPEGQNLALSDLTKDGQAHAFEDENGAVLRKGTRVTVKEVKTIDSGAIWLRIPSGWICGKGASGKVYAAGL